MNSHEGTTASPFATRHSPVRVSRGFDKYVLKLDTASHFSQPSLGWPTLVQNP
jgi:hypothetical protein